MSEPKRKILLVEDEPNLAFNLIFNLQQEGYEVVSAANGKVALELYASHGPFDLILLDVMLPEINGFEVARRIRKDDQITGILMLTAKSGEEDRIQGFKAGVDDYLIKPFSLAELILRIKRMIERAHFYETSAADEGGGDEHESILQADGIELNLDSLHLKTHIGQFDLTVLEANVLREFLLNPDKTLSRQQLLAKVWGIKAHVETRTVDNFIMRLRKYIEDDPSNPKNLVSVRGRGYRLVSS